MKIVVCGLSITSSWGNGHATNYRAVCTALRARDHDVLFLERDKPWYGDHRDFDAPYVRLYGSLEELRDRYADDVREADLAIVGSFVPDGVAVGEWVTETAGGVTAFYDIDTPVTAEKLGAGDEQYLSRELVERYDLYLSFTGGPLLEEIGARRPRPFYCMVPPGYEPVEAEPRWELGHLGTYSDDRRAALEELFVRPARELAQGRFALVGPQYPDDLALPQNVERIEHLAPPDAPAFFAAQRFTLHVTRSQMVRAGWSPRATLFEAAACGVAMISDWWEGLDAFFEPGREILVARSGDDVRRYLTDVSDDERRELGADARKRVLAEHTADRRAEELERHVADLVGAPR